MNRAIAVLCVVAVMATIFMKADSRTNRRPAFCYVQPIKPSTPVRYGYEVYYFDQKDLNCKCYRSTRYSGEIEGNAFHNFKPCMKTCRAKGFSACPRRGLKV
uniref:Putative serpentine type 7tm gpcr chemoreceptor srz n=1 Tax=Ixodes ricinus TaxID=34613 RepID=A0A0K8REX7_IXORI